jgi:signal transduction histidine kinase
MPKRILILFFLFLLLPGGTLAAGQEHLQSFFLDLSMLEFEKARQHAALEPDSILRSEMQQLANILYYEGQVDRTFFKLSDDRHSEKQGTVLHLLQSLSAGYVSLFYDQIKGNAFKNFYTAYQIAREDGQPFLTKPCLLALLKYYNLEIAQNSDLYLPYLKHFESLQEDFSDGVWVTIYSLIFYSKTLTALDDYYFKLADELDRYEKTLDPKSPLLANVFYEKALKYELSKDGPQAREYYIKTIKQAGDYPFLRYHRFFANLKLALMASQNKEFILANRYINKARLEASKTDTLRSSYHLHLYNAEFLHLQNKNDSAYTLLMKAYGEDFQLDFRRNTLEINRLNVELDTQEKENANLRLRENRTWLISVVIGLALLLLVSYFAHLVQRARNKIQLQEKEVQAMRLDKMLKDQELFGLNAMVEGQEKERQRIANDLHDNLGGLLAAAMLHFKSLKSAKERSDQERDILLKRTDDLIEEAYQMVRTMAHAKNAGVNAQDGLLPALETFAAKVSVLDKLVINVKEHGMVERLENSLEITIFRIIQELITNVIKHARATEATIHLTQYDDKINLMIEDNGIGFDSAVIKPGGTMGLYSIQKRVENLDGTVTIDSVAGNGTAVIIDIPLT